MYFSQIEYPVDTLPPDQSNSPNTGQPALMDLIEYTLDAENRIIAIQGAWDEFAIDNNGDEITANNVIGKSLLRYVTGKVTRNALLNLLAKVRCHHVTAVMDYRCDSPSSKRWMRMTLTSEPKGHIRVTCQLIRQQAYTQVVQITCASERNKYTVVRCSLCNRINQQDGWYEVEDLANKHQCFHWLVIYGLCPNCKEMFS